MGRRRIRDLKTRVGRECSISGERLNCTVEVHVSKESEKRVTVLRVGTQQGGRCKIESCKELLIWRGKVVSTLVKPI